MHILDGSALKFGTKDAMMIRPCFRTRAWSYRDLNDVVPRVARYLSGTGMKQGDRVLIWGVNRPEYGIAFLAALRLGAILVPLEANYAAEFAEKIAARTRASAAIVSAQTLARVVRLDRKSTRLNSSHLGISYAVFCLKKKKNRTITTNV